MSRPRKPFGANHPGRLPATMMKVLAAEMSDPQRLRRGKQYAKDGSVLDIIIEPGVVTCEVQGTRATPYIASVEVTRGDGMPLRRDISTHCTCPDDDNWDDYACKHTVAAMFTLSDELLLEPELLDLWRDRDTDRRDGDRDIHRDDEDDGDGDDPGDADLDESDPIDDDHDDDDAFGRRRRHLRLVRPGETGEQPRPTERLESRDTARSTPRQPPPDPLAEVTRVPAGTVLPEVPHLDPSDAPMPKNRQLATVLRDALAHLRIDWD